MLSVITYNIRYGKKLNNIVAWLTTQTTHDKFFDIICFQEFPIAYIQPFLKAISATSFEYRFSHGFRKKDKLYGQLTLFNREKIKLLEDTVLSLGPSILERSKKRGERSSLVTRFQYKNKQFFLANTHLICVALNKRRLRQLEKIIRHFDTSGGAQLPLLVVGDFNYSSLVRQKRLLYFMEGHGFTNAYKTNTFKLLFLRYQLDYVFYKNCDVTDVDVLKLRYSDHFPALFRLQL